MKKKRKAKFFSVQNLVILSDLHTISKEYVKRKSFWRQSNNAQI